MTNSQPKLIDHRYNIQSYEQYLIDMKTKKFNKMCMTEVINADMMIATFGEDDYARTCSEILAMGNMAYQQMGIDHLVHVYVHSYKTFMAVANDDMPDIDFFNLMKTNHQQYELISSRQTGLGGVSRFVLAFGDDLIDHCKSALHLNRDMQNNFIVASDEKERLAAETEETLKMFELIQYAIENDKVVPFYQAIHDNQQNKATKYEALMRIYDQDDNLWLPGTFLEISKQLKLYLPLSKIMIDKSLKDFENCNAMLDINITLYDIQSDDFKDWFLRRIKQHPSPQNITIEFVESEDYNKNEQLMEFLEAVRELGCKIAVDDFGVGFATYTSIVSLKPDIIKIDGGIIRNIHKSENAIIVNSICYMASLIGSEVVAEFVADQDIQKAILDNDITFSQGFYFAKPLPFDQLEF